MLTWAIDLGNVESSWGLLFGLWQTTLPHEATYCERGGRTMVFFLRPVQSGQHWGLKGPTHLFSCQVEG